MIYLFLKKIEENKMKTIVLIVMSSLWLFLACLFGTMGMNVMKKIDSIFLTNTCYRYIYTSKTDSVNEKELSRISSMKEISGVRTKSVEISIDNVEVEILFSELSMNLDLIVPGGSIVEGRELENTDEALLGKSVLDYMGLEYSMVINKELADEDGKKYKIVGVFDDADENVSSGCYVSLADSFEEHEYIIEARTVGEVEDITNYLLKNGYDVVSHASEISEEKEYARIISIIIVFISLAIIFFSESMLYFSVKLTLNGMYTFIAMIKAIGYKRMAYSKLVYTYIGIIQGASVVVMSLLYVVGMQGLKELFIGLGINDIQGIAVKEMMKMNIGVWMCVIFVSCISVFGVSILCIKRLEKLQVGEILCEANQ